MDWQSSRPRHGTVVAYLALFVALGGGAYAATLAPDNSVDSRAIVNGQVKRADLARRSVDASKLGAGAVVTPKLAAGAVTEEKLAPGAVTASRLATDAVSGPKVVDESLTGADINEASLGTVPSASVAANATRLNGLGSSQFVQGTGTTLAGRATLSLGGGGLQQVLTVPGFGNVVGGCGSGGAAIGFVNQAGRDLRVFPFAGADLAPVTVSDGATSGLFPAGVGSAGFTFMQINSTDVTDQRLLTVIATRSAQSANNCPVQAWAVTNAPTG